MKRLIALFLLLSVFLSGLSCSPSLSSSEREELIQIVSELKSLNEEQQKIIERSEKRNEELIQSSKTKQQIIDGQAKLIDELTNLSKEQKKSSKEKVLTNVLIITAVAAVGFAGGCYAGIKIGR